MDTAFALLYRGGPRADFFPTRQVFPNLTNPERFKEDVLPTAFQYDDERAQVASELGL